MGFVKKTIVVYEGQPSRGRAKVKIKLEDGTQLVATDGWLRYPKYQLVLHYNHLPERVIRARDELAAELRRSEPRHATSNLKPEDFIYILPDDLAEGDSEVEVTVRYGRWRPTRTVTFRSSVAKITVL